MPRSTDIPVGSQFTPNLIHLPAFLQALLDHGGDRETLIKAVWKSPARVDNSGIPDHSTRRARLPLEAAVQYGLLDQDWEPTELTRELAALKEEEMYSKFGQHILLNLKGLTVLQAIDQMRADGRKVNGENLARFVTEQGVRVAESNTSIYSLRLWLSKAGVFPETGNYWKINRAKKEELVGYDDDEIAELATLTPNQRDFVKALCRLSPSQEIKANTVRDVAEVKTGRRYDRKNFVKNVLEPLEERSLIELDTGGTQRGKSSVLRTTDKFNEEVLEDFVENTISDLDPVANAYYRERPKDIFEALESNNINEKGRGLEAFAVYVMRLLGLRIVGWRQRAEDVTGRSEIDVLMAGLLGGIATRWQVQCKNTPSGTLRLKDVAREVGLLPLTNASHILVIANCGVTDDARVFQREIMKASNTTLYILDKSDFSEIRESPGSLAAIIRRKSRQIVENSPRSELWS